MAIMEESIRDYLERKSDLEKKGYEVVGTMYDKTNTLYIVKNIQKK